MSLFVCSTTCQLFRVQSTKVHHFRIKMCYFPPNSALNRLCSSAATHKSKVYFPIKYRVVQPTYTYLAFPNILYFLSPTSFFSCTGTENCCHNCGRVVVEEERPKKVLFLQLSCTHVCVASVLYWVLLAVYRG